jgi:hypothetical protein
MISEASAHGHLALSLWACKETKHHGGERVMDKANLLLVARKQREREREREGGIF